MRASCPLLAALFLAACAGTTDDEPTGAPPRPQLLDQALSVAGLTADDFGPQPQDLADADYLPVLGDEMRLSWFATLRSHPVRAAKFAADLVKPLDAALHGPHPVATAIEKAAEMLDRPLSAGPGSDMTPSFDAEITSLCAGIAGPCEAASGAMPSDLGRALAPLVHAIAGGVAARHDLEGDTLGPDFWAREGGFLLLGFGTDRSTFLRKEGMDYLVGKKRGALYGAAARIAVAVEAIDWAPFAGRTGVSYQLATGAGAIQLRGGGDDTYAEDVSVLLRVDLGGNDTYLDGAGSNRDGENPVSVVVDLRGDDRYGYEEVGSLFDRDGILPSDAAGRFQGNTDDECRTTGNCYGPISLSLVSRQGGARNGIAMLFDLAGNDTYRSLRESQGYAQFGVGVLFDGGGDDTYLAEAQSQGSAQFGIGLLVDIGRGKDVHRSITESQGFAYAGGAGFLLDDGGDDVYYCDHGDPARGGVRMYASPQTQVTGNSSFCQGGGFGLRMDPQQGAPASLYLSGGLGLLRDLSGNDRYDASVFAQGTGYWQGTGILSDGAGADRYQADWYVQGAAAHYSVGMLLDGGPGNDVFDADVPPRNMSLGSGHDFSTGVLVNEAGNDTYHVTTLAAGSSNCNGAGLFVDNGGDDSYLATSDYNEGMGNISSECVARPAARSMGIFVDAGGHDTYEGPESDFPRPANDTTWNYVRSTHPGERGGGVDGSGVTGVHAP